MLFLTVLGARPNFIKAFLISKELKKRGHHEIIVHTGQHYDFNMNQVFFQDLHLPPPNYNLGLKGEQIRLIYERLRMLINKHQPQMVLVYGDTNSSLAGGFACYQENIPLTHIEAGARTNDISMVEERNRIIIDHFANLLLCPTQASYDNLIKEKVRGQSFFTGDVMYDAVKYVSKIKKLGYYQKLKLISKKYYLLTIHRQENVDQEQSLLAIWRLFQTIKDYPIVLPLHPRTKKNLEHNGLLEKFERSFRIIKPVGYSEMLSLTKNAKIVFTDSGGLQKEAFFLNNPCITLLKESGWQEIVTCGWNIPVGLNKKMFDKAYEYFMKYKLSKPKEDLFGNGRAYIKTVDIFENFFNKDGKK